MDANATDPLKGIGPGTFEFWWARHGTTPGFIRDAHTLYFETLAETGIVGFALLIGMLAVPALAAAVARSLRAPPGLRIWIAAAVGGARRVHDRRPRSNGYGRWARSRALSMVLAAVILVGRAG